MVEQPESSDTAVDPSTADSDDSEQSDPATTPDGDRTHSDQAAVDEPADAAWPTVTETAEAESTATDTSADSAWPTVTESDQTTEAESSAAESDASTTESDSPTTESDSPTTESDSPTTESDSPTAEVDSPTAEVDSSTAVEEAGADKAIEAELPSLGGEAETDKTAEAESPSVDETSVSEGPDSDQEMPLADHIEEMMRRLGIVFLVAGIVTVVVYPLAGETINFLWSAHIPESPTNRPRLYGPLEFVLTKLKVAGLAGIVIGLPVFVYQTYRFMRPGLYPQERRYYLAAVPTSLVLGVFGVLFAHYLILPLIFSYFTTYTTEAAVIAFGLQETFNLILVMMGWMALVFQIPLFIMLAIMMGLVTRRWLEAKRLIFWGSFVGISFILSPDPTGMAPIMVALTMVGLFEGTLALLRWTGN